MKRAISLLLLILTLITTVFVGCSANGKKDITTTEAGLESNADEYIMDTVEVTDKKGNTVTDKNGEAVTTDVVYKMVKDKNGNKVPAQTDEQGNVVTKKNGDVVTARTTTQKITMATTTKPTTTTTMKNHATATTEKQLTTLDSKNDKVPSLSASGKKVKFSANDQTIVKDMLEVPYLYKSSYDSGSGTNIPTEAAAHAAIWMAQREGLNTSVFASGTIVLDLFKYFGQTVVSFKTKCNDSKGTANIVYNNSSDTFTISSFESHKQTVTLNSIEFLGNNNYYKVTGSVSGADGKTKVIAIIQRNRLDSSLGFSIKAMKWS